LVRAAGVRPGLTGSVRPARLRRIRPPGRTLRRAARHGLSRHGLPRHRLTVRLLVNIGRVGPGPAGWLLLRRLLIWRRNGDVSLARMLAWHG